MWLVSAFRLCLFAQQLAAATSQTYHSPKTKDTVGWLSTKTYWLMRQFQTWFLSNPAARLARVFYSHQSGVLPLDGRFHFAAGLFLSYCPDEHIFSSATRHSGGTKAIQPTFNGAHVWRSSFTWRSKVSPFISFPNTYTVDVYNKTERL